MRRPAAAKLAPGGSIGYDLYIMKKDFEQSGEFSADALSPLARHIHDIFETQRKIGNSAVLVFWRTWGDELSVRGIGKGAWAWAAYDEVMAQAPDSALCLALDLSLPFADQFPVAQLGRMETMQALAMSPVVWITDRAGKIPAREREAFIAGALRPKPRLRLV